MCIVLLINPQGQTVVNPRTKKPHVYNIDYWCLETLLKKNSCFRMASTGTLSTHLLEYFFLTIRTFPSGSDIAKRRAPTSILHEATFADQSARQHPSNLSQAIIGIAQASLLALTAIFAVMGFCFFACVTLGSHPSATASTSDLQAFCQFCGGDFN